MKLVDATRLSSDAGCNGYYMDLTRLRNTPDETEAAMGAMAVTGTT
jgi:hypothetical protein